MAARKKPPVKNAEYVILPIEKKFHKVILALDPGSKNMGIACLGVTKKGRVVVIANSILTNPITSLVDKINFAIRRFLREIDRWVQMFKPDAFIMERFQSRGNMGPLIELVTVMIASICTRYIDKPCKLITAATWKNKFHRKFTDVELKELYKICATTSHQLDAVLIGCYGMELGLKRDLDYTPEHIISQTERTSSLPLRKIRGR